MVTELKRRCVFITGSTDTAETTHILNHLINPALAHIGEFQIVLWNELPGMSLLRPSLRQGIADVDLVIGDLSDLWPDGSLEIGVRMGSELPLVLIMNDRPAILQDPESPPPWHFTYPRGLTEQTALAFSRVIRAKMTEHPSSNKSIAIRHPRERILDLAARIQETAEVIRLLRINSLGDTAEKLEDIAKELASSPEERAPSAIREAAAETLAVLSRILDQLSSVRGARMAISGAVALIIGGSGWPAVTAMGLGLAYWEGKEAFLKALDMLRGHRPAIKDDKTTTSTKRKPTNSK